MFHVLAHTFKVYPAHPGALTWLIISLLPWYLVWLTKSGWKPRGMQWVAPSLALGAWAILVWRYMDWLNRAGAGFGLEFSVIDIVVDLAKSMGFYGPLALTLSLAILIAVHGISEEDYEKGVSDHQSK